VLFRSRLAAGEGEALGWLQEFEKLAESLDFSPTLFRKPPGCA
jgi:hypothetical protein